MYNLHESFFSIKLIKDGNLFFNITFRVLCCQLLNTTLRLNMSNRWWANNFPLWTSAKMSLCLPCAKTFQFYSVMPVKYTKIYISILLLAIPTKVVPFIYDRLYREMNCSHFVPKTRPLIGWPQWCWVRCSKDTIEQNWFSIERINFISAKIQENPFFKHHLNNSPTSMSFNTFKRTMLS